MNEYNSVIGLNKRLGDILNDSVLRQPEKKALIYNGWKITYKQLDDYSKQAANFFIHKGIKKDDAVAIVSRNCPEYVICEIGLFKIGAIVVNVNWRLSTNEISNQLQDCNVKLCVIRDDNAINKELEDKNVDITFIPFIPGLNSSLMNEISKYSTNIECTIDIDLDDDAIYFLTSGSTGRPKIVVHSNRTIIDSLDNYSNFIDIDEKDNYIFMSQLFHVASMTLFYLLRKGSKIVLLEKFDINDYLKILDEEKITFISLIPTTVKLLIDTIKNRNLEFPCLRLISYLSFPMLEKTIIEAKSLFDCEFSSSYGMTETAATISILSPSDHNKGGKYLRTVGRAVPNVEIEIVDEDGSFIRNKVGEIVAKVPYLMKGYKHHIIDNTNDSSRIVNGFYYTGDMGYIDDEGYITLAGRKDDLIISGGENIYPMEITNVVMQKNGVKETTSIGVPDDIWDSMLRHMLLKMMIVN